jgi:hypothetical protein
MLTGTARGRPAARRLSRNGLLGSEKRGSGTIVANSDAIRACRSPYLAPVLFSAGATFLAHFNGKNCRGSLLIEGCRRALLRANFRLLDFFGRNPHRRQKDLSLRWPHLGRHIACLCRLGTDEPMHSLAFGRQLFGRDDRGPYFRSFTNVGRASTSGNLDGFAELHWKFCWDTRSRYYRFCCRPHRQIFVGFCDYRCRRLGRYAILVGGGRSDSSSRVDPLEAIRDSSIDRFVPKLWSSLGDPSIELLGLKTSVIL